MHAARMPLFVCGAFNVFSCSRCFGLQLPLLSFVADSVTVHAHEYVYLSILRSSLSTFSVNLAITVRNVTSRKKYSGVIAKSELKVWRYANFAYVK